MSTDPWSEFEMRKKVGNGRTRPMQNNQWSAAHKEGRRPVTVSSFLPESAWSMRHIFKAIFCLSSLGWYSWPNAALEPDVDSLRLMKPLYELPIQRFHESDFVRSLNFRNKVLSKLLILRCQFFLTFYLSVFSQNSISSICSYCI